MKISQSLIKEVQKTDHCPKQIMYSFIEGRELIDPSEPMLLGRYFETELLGSCRGGAKQEPNLVGVKSLKPSKSSTKKLKLDYLHQKGIEKFDNLKAEELFFEIAKMPDDYSKGEKSKPFSDCDDLVLFAKEIFKKLGLDVKRGKSQLDIQTELLKGAIDFRDNDIENPKILANYDVKWTATKEDDRWNGWANPEDKQDAITQGTHYTILSYEETGVWMPFYFLVFGKDKWVKVIRYKFTPEQIDYHKELIANTASTIREYAVKEYKGNGSFNKCLACPFYDICEDKSLTPEIQTIVI